ncbi:MAG: hypothetical protein IRZ20_06910 [Thermoleophilia bacterium]|nr:hypothetical protein [Thermoleophilia bacterium]
MERGVGVMKAARAGGRIGGPSADEVVELATVGEAAVGEFRCAECGYGVIVQRELPACPMCGGTRWEQSAWSPFTRTHTGPEPR